MEPALTADDRRRRLLVIAVAGGLALLLLIGVGVYGLLRGASAPTNPATPVPRSVDETPAPNSPGDASPTVVEQNAGPEAFARAVAGALFAWDAASGYGPSEYVQVLADVAADAEADVLVDDVRAYLPSAQAWTQLRQHQTRQWLTIDDVTIPDSWQIALDQAAPGQIPEGSLAYSITGTRHRAGTWGTTPLETSRPVAFTVFIICPRPNGANPGPCELLRLSQLDNPLR